MITTSIWQNTLMLTKMEILTDVQHVARNEIQRETLAIAFGR